MTVNVCLQVCVEVVFGSRGTSRGDVSIEQKTAVQTFDLTKLAEVLTEAIIQLELSENCFQGNVNPSPQQRRL